MKYESLAFCRKNVYNYTMRKLGAIFYIILLLLTAAVLVLLSLWIKTREPICLYLMLVAFAVYLFHLVYSLLRSGRNFKKSALLRSSYLSLLNSTETKIVYITYLGNERRVRKPSKSRKDYLVEFYCGGVDCEKLKRHLWYDLPQKDENELKRSLIGGMDIPYSLLSDISNKKVLLQARFFEAATGSPNFSDFLSSNEITLYGE